jgi:peroxiredoxin
MRFRSLGLTAFMVAALAAGFGFQKDAEKEIGEKIGSLRGLPDAERAKVTYDTAMAIRNLPAGRSKLGLASSLGNLATEGDFGEKALQAVTTTLDVALAETPAPKENGNIAFAYTELAQLARYEHMKVKLKSADYEAAMARLIELDKARAKVDFTLNDITGKSWTLSSLKGKVVLVNFWATWCPPCRKEMPDIQALYNRFKDKGFVVIAISDETIDKVQPYITDHKYTYPVFLDPGRKVNGMYTVEGIPKNFVYDRNGKLVAQSIDMRTQGQFLKMLAAAGLK